MRNKIIAIDFDGTIVDQAFPRIGEIKKHAKEVINRLYEDYYIIIWSCRCGCDAKLMQAYLDKQGIKYHTINRNISDISFGELEYIPHPKVFAHVYIDDRGLIQLPSWKKIEKIVRRNK
jgi:hypothetical protein